MRTKYQPTYKGYLIILKAIQLLLKDRLINFTQLGAYISFVMQSDFDRRHKNYGVLIRDDEELAIGLGCNKSTIYRLKKTLLSKGLLIERDGNIAIANPNAFTTEMVKLVASHPPKVSKNIFLNLHKDEVKKQFNYAETKSISIQIPP